MKINKPFKYDPNSKEYPINNMEEFYYIEKRLNNDGWKFDELSYNRYNAVKYTLYLKKPIKIIKTNRYLLVWIYAD